MDHQGILKNHKILHSYVWLYNNATQEIELTYNLYSIHNSYLILVTNLRTRKAQFNTFE